MPPIREVFATRLRAAREERGSSQAELAARMAELGLPIHQTAIAKIEAGDRNVSLDEAVTFAAALDVPLATLLVPIDAPDDVDVAPHEAVHRWRFYEWLLGRQPLEVTALLWWNASTALLDRYERVRAAQLATQDADLRLRRAKQVRDDEQRRVADTAYVYALVELHDALESMEAAGMPTDGLLHDQFERDMRRLKIMGGAA